MRTILNLTRWAAAAGLAWLAYPVVGLVLYAILLVVAIVSGQPLGGPLGGPFLIALVALAGVGCVAISTVSAGLGELAARPKRRSWVASTLLGGTFAVLLVALGVVGAGIARGASGGEILGAWLVVGVLMAPAVVVTTGVSQLGAVAVRRWAPVRVPRTR